MATFKVANEVTSASVADLGAAGANAGGRGAQACRRILSNSKLSV